jgi:hypothetical protein
VLLILYLCNGILYSSIKLLYVFVSVLDMFVGRW